MMKVSVIIPVYNMYEYLRECIDSVLRQSIDSLEVICIDDGSDDGSYELLLEYEKHNEKIIILKQNQLGPGVARNRGIEMASGEYVCMMDSDDFYPNPFVLEMLYNTAQKERTNICGGNIVNFYPDGTIVDDATNFRQNGFLNSYEYPRLYGQTRFLYRRDFLIDNNLRYLPYVRYEDPPFVLETIMTAGKYYVLDKPVYVRRTGYKNSATKDEYAYGVLVGIQKCTQLAAQYNLRKFFRKEIKSLVFSNLNNIYRELCKMESECWDVIAAINSIFINYDNERLSPFYDYNSFYIYFEKIKRIVCGIKNYKRIVIYGAGIMAQELLVSGILDKEKIIAFATSDIPEQQEFNGYKLKCIDSFLNGSMELLYIIAAGVQNGDEMERKLLEAGIDNYYRISGEFLYAVKAMQQLD